MQTKVLTSLAIAGWIRYFLITSKYSQPIKDRVEVSTPLNSWKRVQEGAFLHAQGVDPYDGDIYHENPLILVATSYLLHNLSALIPLLFVLLDLLVGVFLYLAAKASIQTAYTDEQRRRSTFAKGTEDLHIQKKDLLDIPFFTLLAYIFNPYAILNCVGQTTTVWSNFLLAAFFFSLARGLRVPACIVLALETQRNFYPWILIVPAALSFARGSRNRVASAMCTLSIYIAVLVGLYKSAAEISGGWSFVDSTIGFIVYYRDLQPNIGLFWYFFTEMFDHFRTLFLYTFQINATILYLLPLTLKLHDKPMFLATLLTALIGVFRSYPCVGDLALYMALFPIWKPVSRFMTHNFIVGGTFLVTSILAPVVWHLWINAASANANFYFGVTLVFATAQIFLLTDLLFADFKRDYCLQHGLKFELDGKEARMALE